MVHSRSPQRAYHEQSAFLKYLLQETRASDVGWHPHVRALGAVSLVIARTISEQSSAGATFLAHLGIYTPSGTE